MATVRVLYDTEEQRLAGYCALSAVVVERGDLPPGLTHRVAKCRVYPAALIGGLAVDRAYQGRRLGGRLLLDALALAPSSEIGSFAAVMDAKDEDAQSFYEHYGFQPLPTAGHGRRLFLPMGTVERLFAG